MAGSSAVLGYLASALAGGIITYLFQNYVRLLTEDVALLNDHIEDIAAIETAAVNYWLSDAKHNSVEELSLRARLSGSLVVSSCFRAEANRLLGNRLEEYKKLDGQIFDTATGGSFETAERDQNIEIATSIIGYCHRMRAELRAARRAIFWFR